MSGHSRGQSTVIGAILVFAILVISLSIFAGVMVPDQNEGVEFDQFLETRSELVELRNAILNAGESGGSVAADVTLGTRYPNRILVPNPAPATGRLEAAPLVSQSTAIRLENTDADLERICGYDPVSPKAVVYTPDYNYLTEVGNVTYENTVLYHHPSRGSPVIESGQRIVDGDTIRLYPIVGNVTRGSSSERVSVEFSAGVTGRNSSVPGGFDLVLPTRLPATVWEDRLLRDQEHVVDVEPVAGAQAVRIEFEPNEQYAISCTPVGAGFTPDNRPQVLTQGDSLNPNYGSDVVLTEVAAGAGKNSVVLTLENTNDDEAQNLTAVRFPFFYPNTQGGSARPPAESLEIRSTVLERLGRTRSIPTIEFQPGQTRDVTVTFFEDPDGTTTYDLKNGDFFVFTAQYDTGKQRTYYVALPDEWGS